MKYTDAKVPHTDAAHAAHRELQRSHDNAGYRFAVGVTADGARVNFGENSSQWTTVTGCTNMWGSHKRPSRLDPNAPKSWQVRCTPGASVLAAVNLLEQQWNGQRFAIQITTPVSCPRESEGGNRWL